MDVTLRGGPLVIVNHVVSGNHIERCRILMGRGGVVVVVVVVVVMVVVVAVAVVVVVIIHFQWV